MVAAVSVLLVACERPWQLDFVNDTGRPWVVTVETASGRASWLAESGEGLTLMYSAPAQSGRVQLVEPDTCEVLDDIELPAVSSTLFIEFDLRTEAPELLAVLDAPAVQDLDPPDAGVCP
jgi:hypothetical protein